MIIDYSNTQVFDGMITFPDTIFGDPPAGAGSIPGVGGLLIERVIVGGTTGDVTSEAGGIVDDVE